MAGYLHPSSLMLRLVQGPLTATASKTTRGEMEMPALWSQINLTLCGVDLEVSYSSSPKQCAKLLPLRSQKKKKILDAFFLLTLLYVA